MRRLLLWLAKRRARRLLNRVVGLQGLLRDCHPALYDTRRAMEREAMEALHRAEVEQRLLECE